MTTHLSKMRPSFWKELEAWFWTDKTKLPMQSYPKELTINYLQSSLMIWDLHNAPFTLTNTVNKKTVKSQSIIQMF